MGERSAEELAFAADVVNESVVIAAALADGETRKRLTSTVPPDTFLVDEHRALWATLTEMERRHLGYDPATLVRLAGGSVRADYLQRLVDARPDAPPNLSVHVDALLWDKAKHTSLTGPIAALLELLRDPTAAPDRAQALGQQVAMSLRGYKERRHLHDADELVRAQMAEIRARIQGKAVYPFGIAGLDFYDPEQRTQRRIIPGAAPGQITVITGVPGSGKSTFVAHLVLGIVKQRRRVLVGAWEMTGGMTLELLTVISLGWSRSELLVPKTRKSPGTALREGVFLTEERLAEMEARMRLLAQYVFFMKVPRDRQKKGRNRQTNDDVLDVMESYIADVAPEVVVFDLWKRAMPDTKPEQEEDALDRQQEMAKDLAVHVVLVQQQRLKDIEQREDKRPTREGIKGSGAWVEVADTILGVHRPALWKPQEDTVLEVALLKQRYGKWPVAVSFDWVPDTGALAGGVHVDYDIIKPAKGGGGQSVDGFMKAPKKKREED